MAKPTKKTAEEIIEEAAKSETVKALIDKLAPTMFTGLTIDKNVHEFLTSTSVSIAEQKSIEKLNGYLDSVCKVDTYLAEQISIYETYYRLDLKMVYDEKLTIAKRGNSKSEMALVVELPEIKNLYISMNIIEQHLANLKRYSDKVKTRMDALKQIIISKSVSKARSY